MGKAFWLTETLRSFQVYSHNRGEVGQCTKDVLFEISEKKIYKHFRIAKSHYIFLATLAQKFKDDKYQLDT